MAAKLARLFNRMLKYGQAYVDRGDAQYEAKHQEQKFTKQAAQQGFALVPLSN